MFFQIFFSPQVNWCAIITYKHGLYEISQVLSSNLKLRILGIFSAGGAFVPTQEKKKTQDPKKLGNIRKVLTCQNQNLVNTNPPLPPTPAAHHPAQMPEPAPNTPPTTAERPVQKDLARSRDNEPSIQHARKTFRKTNIPCPWHADGRAPRKTLRTH